MLCRRHFYGTLNIANLTRALNSEFISFIQCFALYPSVMRQQDLFIFFCSCSRIENKLFSIHWFINLVLCFLLFSFFPFLSFPFLVFLFLPFFAFPFAMRTTLTTFHCSWPYLYGIINRICRPQRSIWTNARSIDWHIYRCINSTCVHCIWYGTRVEASHIRTVTSASTSSTEWSTIW